MSGSNSPAGRLSAALSGRYRIERELGAGGMATVYLAEDLKHDRKVAIKVLKPELAAVLGAERFVVEIKTTAAMSHPHILPLFDSGTAEGFLFYVMPYIQGETIREKLNRETQFGVDEAVRIAREVADALDYAHRHGVIHRDIKPENVLLHDGRPMVMDFGIALAVSAAAGGRMTETGLSLGTPHYMSPEQATADKQITARSDVYSLASVLYEMLAGEPPHTGGSAQAIIMKIIAERAQPVTELRGSVPPNVAAALAKALEKMPADRFEGARAFADALGNPGYSNAFAAGGVGVAGPARGISPRLYWATAAVAVLAMAAAMVGWFGRAQPPASVTRFVIAPSGEEGVTAIQADRELAISPDGSRIVWVGNSGAGMFARSMDGLDVVSLVQETTQTPRGPFFSPDGEWVGFFGAGGGVFKVAVTGGPPVPIANLDGQRRGGTWGEDGTIVYATSDSTSGLWRVSGDGGAPQQLTTSDRTRGEGDHVFPQFLPGARAVLFTILPPSGGIEGASMAVLDLKSGSHKIVVRGGSDGRYASSGHLVYGAAGTLRAVRFDLKRLEAIGSPTTVQTSVATRGGGAAQFDVAGNGTLIYVPTTADSAPMALRTLVWVDRQGRESPIRAPARAYIVPRIAPDGGRVALEVRDQDRDIWVWDFSAETLGRVTFGAGADLSPIWTPDGRSLVFRSAASGRDPGTVRRQAADGSGAPELLAGMILDPTSITPDGKSIIGFAADGGGSVWVLTPGQNGVRQPLAMGQGVWRNGELSPDGRWLAYSGAATGLFQIYIRPFPVVNEGRWQVTTEGGSKPAWSRDGKELFYLDPTGAMMRVAVDAGTTWKAGAPSKLFDGRYFVGASGRTYDVSPDGRRFLMIKPSPSELAAQSATAEATTARSAEQGIVVVQHWEEELKRLVPKK